MNARSGAIVLALAMTYGCGTDDFDLFGDQGTSSQTAAELLAKNDPITNDRIAGVYEDTGSTSGLYPVGDTTYRVTNNFVYRLEFRGTKLTTVFQCSLTYTEPGRAPKTMTLFTQQAAESTATFYRTTEAGNKTETDPVSQSDCNIDQPATAWAYCEEKYEGSYTKQPDGSNICIGRRDQYLMIVEGNLDDYNAEVAKKVAN